MTYKELLERLKELDDEQLSADVTIYDKSDEEYYPVVDTDTCELSGYASHPILILT